jgi:hypothetical protein
MKFLVDKSANDILAKRVKHPDFILGQLLTPLTRFSNGGDTFAIDNGAFSGFDAKAFRSLLEREQPNKQQCLFVTIPDIVGNARRTLELWQRRARFAQHWPAALVAQDGIEDMEIPWCDMAAVFIGGRDPWKDSQAALDIVKTAKALAVHVHVGRVNTAKRFRLFAEAGADTCDGSGVAMYDHMLDALVREMSGVPAPTLFDVGGKDRFECEYCN